METKFFTVSRIDGDYAWLTSGEPGAEPVFIARALLPPEIDEGSRLKFENFQFETLDDIMSDRFGSYSKYIIQERALPDARDGLKPVQRRILYSMYIDGNTFENFQFELL